MGSKKNKASSQGPKERIKPHPLGMHILHPLFEFLHVLLLARACVPGVHTIALSLVIRPFFHRHLGLPFGVHWKGILTTRDSYASWYYSCGRGFLWHGVCRLVRRPNLMSRGTTTVSDQTYERRRGTAHGHIGQVKGRGSGKRRERTLGLMHCLVSFCGVSHWGSSPVSIAIALTWDDLVPTFALATDLIPRYFLATHIPTS